MPAMYRYTCHNPRCPWKLDRGKEFTFNAVPKKQDGSSDDHFHCPYCNCGTDTHMEAVAFMRVGFGEATKHLRPKVDLGFRASTKRILPVPSQSGGGKGD